MRSVRRSLLAASLLALATLAACPDATEAAGECAAADLIGQCPPGSSPVLGAQAESACGGDFSLKVVTEEGAATGQCASNGSCSFLCQYANPCSCGVASLSRDQIVCAECPDQSCGDGRCEGTERPTCAPGEAGCFPCLEDCGGSTCGDGDCTGDESPTTCPQDCEEICRPSEKLCVGTRAVVCSADGRSTDEFDCATAGLICGQGTCVAPGACGNHACEANESAASCPQDCGSVCAPSSVSCQGNLLVTCNGTGSDTTQVDCALSGLVCAGGACKPADVCGNSRCEAGEDASCPEDCAAVCNNHVCENGETNACPQDCTTCGDHLCGAGELTGCPQDCGICLPSERFCLGKLLRVCNANGTDFEDVDCTAFDQACAAGNCIEPGVCGNGACEQDEDVTNCPDDCTTVCGDKQCEGQETFTTCSSDCVPQCGDASCQGDETFAGCPLDCLATCGNGVCDSAEDRDNCPKDCGYCGNGACEDAAESASLFPPAPLVTCLEDCVTSGCETAADCDDGIFCTAASCDDGVCHYQAQDDLCPAGDKCIKFSGCCADDDHDGYADIACGGSDCDDGDALVHPGAVEPCGGGDRNCNGHHRPQLKPAKKVTNSVSYKRDLAMTFDGTRFWASWTGTPEATPRVEYARITTGGDVAGAITAVPLSDEDGGASRTRIAWSPESQRLGLVWHQDGSAYFTTVSADGVLSDDAWAEMRSGEPGNHYAYTYADITGLTWSDGVWVMSDSAWYNNGAAGVRIPYGWWAVTELGDLTRRFSGECYYDHQCYGGTSSLITAGAQVAGIDKALLYKADASDVTGHVTMVNMVPAAAQGDCQLGWDGETLVLVCKYDGKLSYHRIAPNGAALESANIAATTLLPSSVAVAEDGLAAGDSGKVAVVGLEGGNVVFLMRDVDTSAVVEPGAIGGGVAVAAPWVFWDGDVFQAFWLAKSGDIEQLFRTTVTCE